jgi:AcrR family transcriptional regulator
VNAPKRKSQTVPKLRDARAVRTLQQLDAAFLGLLHRRAYAGIRVSDITRKAGVGRATFYAHYTSKHELLRSQMRRIVAPMLCEMPAHPPLIDCTAFFRHVRHAPFIYRSLLSGTSLLQTERIVRDCIEERVAALLASGESRARRDRVLAPGVVARFVAGSLLTLATWWIETESGESPAEMQSAFESLVGGGLRGVASDEVR